MPDPCSWLQRLQPNLNCKTYRNILFSILVVYNHYYFISLYALVCLTLSYFLIHASPLASHGGNSTAGPMPCNEVTNDTMVNQAHRNWPNRKSLSYSEMS